MLVDMVIGATLGVGGLVGLLYIAGQWLINFGPNRVVIKNCRFVVED